MLLLRPDYPHLIFGYLTETRWLRLASFTAFYFAQGVPIGLLTIALPAWLAEQGSSRRRLHRIKAS